MRSDVNVQNYTDYATAVAAPSHLPNHAVYAPRSGERGVSSENQVTTGSGFSPKAVAAATPNRGARGVHPNGDGYREQRGMQRGMMGGILTPRVLIGAAVLAGIYLVFIRKS